MFGRSLSFAAKDLTENLRKNAVFNSFIYQKFFRPPPQQTQDMTRRFKLFNLSSPGAGYPGPATESSAPESQSMPELLSLNINWYALISLKFSCCLVVPSILLSYLTVLLR